MRRGRPKKLRLAFHVWVEGLADYEPNDFLDPASRMHLIDWSGGVERVPRRDLRYIVTDEHRSMLAAWGEWRRKGWPMSGGWYDAQPAWLVDIVDAVEQELSHREARQMETTKNADRDKAMEALHGGR